MNTHSPKTELRTFLRRIRKEANALRRSLDRRGDVLDELAKRKAQTYFRCADSLSGLLVSINYEIDSLKDLGR